MVEENAQIAETTETTETVQKTSAPLGSTGEAQADTETAPSKFVSSAEKVAEALDVDEVPADTSGADEETLLKQIDDEIKEASKDLTDEEMASAEKIAAKDETEDTDISETAETSDSEEVVASGTTDGKPNIEKRISKLVAEREQAREELATAKAQIVAFEERLQKIESGEKPAAKKDERLSDAEIKTVLQTAIEEGDAQTILDIVNYKTKITKEDAIKELQAREQQTQEKIKQHNLYWETIQREFSPDSYKSELVKKDDDFNLKNPNSLLYKKAESLFLDPKNFKKYREKGDMRTAVQDAFIELLSEKIESKGKSKKNETEGAMNRKSKENRRKSAGTGTSSVEASTAAAIAEAKDELDEVLSERKQLKAKRIGGTGI